MVFQTFGSRAVRTAFLCGSALSCAPAIAQTATPPAPAIGNQPTAGATPAGDIIVTGSRIARKDLSSDSPLVTVSAEQFKLTNAVTLDDTLYRLPQVTPAFGQASNDTATGGVTTIGLRGLGAPRTLVLLDGRRMTAATFTGAADLNMIPKSLIQSVEVITGGASAAYGSDAIAGVVNFKLNHRFSGVLLDGQAGVTERGDGGTQSLSLTAGGNFSDNRGNAVLSLEYENRDGVNNRDRSFSAVSRPSSSLPFGTFSPSATNLPSQAAVNAVFAQYGVAPGAATATGLLGFNNNGTLFTPTGSNNFLGGAGDILSLGNSVFYNSSGVNGLTIPFKRFGAFGRAEYEVAHNVTAYVQAGFQHVTSATVFAPGFTAVSVPVTNPFIPTDLRTILASRPNPTANFTLNRRYADVGARTASASTNGYMLLAGVTAKIDAIDGSVDAFVSRGYQALDERDQNNFSLSALNTLINAADGGASLCAGGFNPFGNQANTACANYIRRSPLRQTVTSQDTAELSVQGRVFKLPAGDLRFAAGVDYRRDSFTFTPDSGLAAGDIVSFSTGAIPAVDGSTTVKEAFGELLIPIIHDVPLIQEVNLNVGYRYSDYNTSGGISTYRAEGDWKVFDALRFRGGYARAARAPNVYELYSPQTPSSPVIGSPGAVGQGDPCDVRSAYRTGSAATQVRALCLAQGVPNSIIDSYTFTNTQLTDGAVTGGNPNLKPEKADTYTVGGVLTPRFRSSFVSNVSLSVDYYHIDLKQAIGTIDGASALRRCFNLGGFNTTYSNANTYCAIFGRSSDNGQINRAVAANLNLGRIETSGIDLAVAATFKLGYKAGHVDFNGTVNWTQHYLLTNFPGDAPTELAGSIGSSAGSSAGVSAAFPKWKGVANLTYRNGPFQIGGQVRYISAMQDVSAVGVTNSTAIGTPAYQYYDLNGQVRVSNRLTFRLGVVNLGDKQPPVYTSFYQSNTYPGVYDVLGRSFYAGASVKF